MSIQFHVAEYFCHLVDVQSVFNHINVYLNVSGIYVFRCSKTKLPPMPSTWCRTCFDMILRHESRHSSLWHTLSLMSCVSQMSRFLTGSHFQIICSIGLRPVSHSLPIPICPQYPGYPLFFTCAQILKYIFFLVFVHILPSACLPFCSNPAPHLFHCPLIHIQN